MHIDAPPWLVCDAFNGSMLLLVDIAGSRLPNADAGQRALFMIPLCIAVAYTTLWGYHAHEPRGGAITSWSRDVVGGSLTPPLCTAISTAYSIGENAMVVSGVVTLIEGEQRSWGVMTCIPLLVLCLSCVVGRVYRTAMLVAMVACAPLLFVGSAQRLPPNPSRHTLDGTGVFGAMVAPGLVLLSTPALFGGSRYTKGWRRGVSWMAGVWYTLIFLLITSPPSAASWPGVVCVFSCLLLTHSFRGWGTNLRVALSMGSVLLGLCLSGDSAVSWWCRFGVCVCIGVLRMGVMWMGDPYLTGLGSERQVNADMRRRREEEEGCMFRVDCLDPLLVS